MSSFKEQIRKDITGVFLNRDEFSDIHNINGREMTVQIDENEALDRNIKADRTASGVYVNQKLIYVSAADFGKLPTINGILKLDGLPYYVADAVEEGGIYSITLEKRRT